MRIVFLISILVFTRFFSFGQQNDNVLWGPDYKLSSKMSLGEILGHDSDQFYLLKYYGTSSNLEVQLESYSVENLEITKSFPLDLYYKGGEEFNIEVTWKVEDKIWIFTTHFNKKNNTIYCYSQLFGLDGQKASEKLLVEEISVTSRRELGNFDFIQGIDKSVAMMVYSPPVDKYDYEAINYHMVSVDQKIIWSEKLELSHPADYFEIIKHVVHDSSHVYVLGVAYTNRVNAANKSQVKNTGKYALYSYNRDERLFNESTLTLNGKYITSATMMNDTSGNLYLIGLFSKTRSFSVSGAFYLKSDLATGELVEKGFSVFDSDLLRKFISDKKIRNNKELDSFDIQDLFVDSAGQVTLLAEQFFVTSTTYSDPRTGHIVYTYYYHYNDLLVLKFDKSGRIIWGKRIPKEQKTLDKTGYFESYAAISKDNRLAIAFNDNPKNIEYNPDPKAMLIHEMDDPSSSVAVLVRFVDDVGGDKQVLFDAKEADYIFNPNIFYRIDEVRLIMFAQGYKNYRFIRVKLK